MDYVEEFSSILARFTRELPEPAAAKASQLASWLEAALDDSDAPLALVFADASYLLAELGDTAIDPVTQRSFAEYALRARDIAEAELALLRSSFH